MTFVPVCQLPASTRYSVRALPLVVSETLAVLVTFEIYQLFFPEVPESDRISPGTVVSICNLILAVLIFPAWSVTRASTS